MGDANRALTIQLLEWISNRPRTYVETLEAWHSSCPRLSIWEDACIAGLIDHDRVRDVMRPSAKGRAFLKRSTGGDVVASAASQVPGEADSM